jgi:hypothetical protein
MGKKLHTGEKVTQSGIYRVRGTKEEIILSTGDKVPPYDGKGANVELVRKVKHKRGK